jgi:hypothetical protein
MQRQAFGTVGVKIEPALSRQAVIGRMADRFMRESGLKKETGWEQVQNDEASYTKLRQALRDNDSPRAAGYYKELLQSRSEQDINNSMKLAYQRPFTGNADVERFFIVSLTLPQLEMYEEARQKLIEDYVRFVSWVATQP